DRNRLALEAEIAGAALHGIENICCLTGDDVTAGDEPEARRVFDLDSIQLLALGASMTQGTYLSGRKIDPAPKLFLGAVENPGAGVLRRRVRARRACALAARGRRPAPDQLPQGGRHRPALPAPRDSDPQRKGDRWIPSSSRGLRPSSSVRSSRSA